MRALAEAYASGDCATVLRDVPAFTSERSARMEEAGYYWGRCLQQAGDDGAALEKLEPIAHADPPGRRADDALYYLGRAYYSLGRNDEAGAAFDELIAARRDSTYLDNAYYWRVLVALRGNDCALARSLSTELATDLPQSEYVAKTEQKLSEGGCAN